MKYKALILDVDGTLVPVRKNALPSLKVVSSLKKISKNTTIHLITARPLTASHNLPSIFKSLPFLNESIINGGAQIINPQTSEITTSIPLKKSSFKELIKLLGTFPDVVAINSMNESHSLRKTPLEVDIIKVVAVGVKSQQIVSLMKRLATVKDIASYETTSYKNGSDIIITHKRATKEYSLRLLMTKYKLKKEEMIGVGDTTHDLPFLLKCGVKVAMGNAQVEVKNIADFVAPHVDDDGLVAVLEKYL